MTGMHRAPAPEKKPVTNNKSEIFIGVVVGLALIVSIITYVVWHVSGSKSDHKSVPVTVQSTSMSTSAAPSAPVTSTPLPSAPATTTAPPTPIRAQVYIVRPGDNLTMIAAYFHANGYGSIYEWNKDLIGNDPNLIHPGQSLIVSPGNPPPIVVNP